MSNILTTNATTKASDQRSDVAHKGNSQRDLKVKIPLLSDLNQLPKRFVHRRKRGVDSYAYILGALIRKSEQKGLSFNTYHTLSSKYLTKLFRADYYTLIQALVENEYILEYSNPYTYKKGGITYTCKGTFKAGKSGKKYAINVSKFSKDKKGKLLLRDYSITDKNLVTKINNIRIENTKRTVEAYPMAKKLFENIQKLSIKEEEALEFVRVKFDEPKIKRYGKLIVKSLGKQKAKLFISEIQTTKSKKKLETIFRKYKLVNVDMAIDVRETLGKYNGLISWRHTIKTIKQISEGSTEMISISRDHKTGRMFSNMTMIPSDLRDFVRLDNQSLAEVDGSNAQWWLLIDYLKKLYNILDYKNFHLNNTNTYKEAYIRHPLRGAHLEERNRIKTTPPIGYMLYTFSEEEDYNRVKGGLQRELYTLEAMLESGAFRKWFVARYDRQGKTVNEKTVKMRLIKYILFGNVNERYYHDSDIVKFFKERFPLIHRTISDLKTKGIDNELFGYDDKDRWKCLALILQSKESEIFIDGMVFTDAVFLTIHDAIITNKDNLHKVSKTLSNGLKTFGVKMKLGDPKYYK